MDNIFKSVLSRLAVTLLLAGSCIPPGYAQNINQVPDKDLPRHTYCGTTADLIEKKQLPPAKGNVDIKDKDKEKGGGMVPQGISAPAFPSYAIVTCGKFDVYYEDLVSPNTTGFNDPSLGAQRRATLCAVLNYIENTFDLSNVSSSNHIKLHVDQSYDNTNPAPAGTGYFAYAIPQYNPFTNGIVNGYIADYIRYGVFNTNSDGYQGEIKVNFDKTYYSPSYPGDPVNYLDDYTQTMGNCQVDLFSVLLHEMGHAMGWFSLVKCTSPGPGLPFNLYNNLPVQAAAVGYNRFSGLDYNMHAGTPPSSFTKLINGSTFSPTLNTSLTANNNIWLNNQAAPHNHGVFSGEQSYLGEPAVQSYFSHLDVQLLTYSERARLSPGDMEDYCMGPFGLEGKLRRSFSKGEILAFKNTMGYPINSTFSSTNSAIFNNAPPHSSRMAAYTNYHDLDVSEVVAADFPPLYNDGVSTLVIDLSNPATLAASGITDANGDPISVMPNTLVNYRGCGSGGNNHNQLSVTNGGQLITYTPRQGFYGRAQFGFNLWDGKEKGSFIVFTVDVKRDVNVTTTPGLDLLVNGNFEEGIETKTVGTDELIPNAISEQFIFEQKFSNGHLSDGHPYACESNPWGPIGGGTLIRDADINCSNSLFLKARTHAYNGSFPTGGGHPNSAPTGGDRYQICDGQYMPGSGVVTGKYYYLKNDVSNCHRYTLMFDAYQYYASSNALQIDFLNDITGTPNWLNPSYNYQLNSPVPISLTTSWQSYSVSFWYCGNPSNILSITPQNGGIFIDNITLTEDLNPAPIGVTIVQTPGTGCTTQLTAVADFGTPYHCTESYTWSNGATGSTIIVSNSGTSNTYTVTVSDGCRTQTATTTVTGGNPITITPSQAICAGNQVPLSVTGMTNPVWSPATGLSCTNCANPLASPATTTTYTVSGTDNNGCPVSVQTTITVSPMPNISITGNTTLCRGEETILTASGATTYSWSPTTGLSCPTCATTLAYPTTTTTYTVTGSNPGGCTGTATVTITVNPVPVVTLTPAQANICAGGTVTLTAGGANTYSWYPSTGLSCPTCQVTNASPSVTTTYYVNGTVNGCTGSAQAIVNVSNINPSISGNLNCVPTILTASPSGGSYTYSWTGPVTGTGNPFTATQPGTYTVTVTDAQGCSATATVTVTAGGGCCDPNIAASPNTVHISSSYSTISGNNVPGYTSSLHTYFGGFTATTTNYIEISGTLIVDKDFEFNSCPNIVFKPGARIYNNTGHYITFKNCVLRAGCNTMWYGIEAVGTNSVINVYYSELRDMEQGVVARNDAQLNITDNKFLDNLYSMQVWNSSASRQYKNIIRNFFHTTNQLLMAPYAGQIGKGGIYVENAHYLLVGDEFNAANGNTFDNLRTGIYMMLTASNGGTDIFNERFYNNLFTNIKGGQWGLPIIGGGTFTDLYNDPDGTAIFGRNTTSNPNAITYVTVSHPAGNSSNGIFNCSKAVTLYGMGLTMENALVKDVIWGLSMGKPNFTPYTIRDNTFSNAYRSIDFVDAPQTATVSKNTINTSSTNQLFFNGASLGDPVGINVAFYQNTSTNYVRLESNNIYVNSVGGAGINLLNTGTGTSIYKNWMYLTTSLQGSGSGLNNRPLTGITLNNSYGTTLEGNHVNGNSNYSNPGQNPTVITPSTTVAGIYANKSKSLLLHCNHTRDVKYGFLIADDCTTTPDRVEGNTFLNHQNGMLFRRVASTNGTFGDIGTLGYDRNNLFNGTYYATQGGFRMKVYFNTTGCTGALPIIYTSNGTLTQNESNGNVATCFYKVANNSAVHNTSASCQSIGLDFVKGTPGRGEVIDVARAETIASGKTAYPFLGTGTKWMDEKMLYDALSGDEKRRESSPALREFYTTRFSSAMEDIRKTEELVTGLSNSSNYADMNTLSAWLKRIAEANEHIKGQDEKEQNEQLIGRLYVKYMLHGIESVNNTEDLEVISRLALQCPYIGGSAVSKARMLYAYFVPAGIYDDLELCDKATGTHDGRSLLGEENAALSGLTLPAADNMLTVAPNPGNGEFRIRYALKAGDKGQVDVYDAYGRIVRSITLKQESSIQPLDMTDAPVGIYHYRYVLNGVTHSTGKIVLVK